MSELTSVLESNFVFNLFFHFENKFIANMFYFLVLYNPFFCTFIIIMCTLFFYIYF